MYMISRKASFLRLATIVLVLSIAFGLQLDCAKRQEVRKVTLAMNKTLYCGPLYVASAKGYWEQEGLDVTIREFAAGRFCLEAVLGGAADLGTVADIPLSLAGLSKQEFFIIATMTWGDGDLKIVARKDRGILSPLDLRGKKVAALFGTSSDFYLRQFTRKYNIDLGELKIVNMRLQEMPTALLKGDVEACSIWEPFGYYAVQQLGDKAVVFTEKGIYDLPHNLMAMKQFVVQNPEIIRTVLRVLVRAENFIKENHADAVQIIAKATDLQPEVLEQIWDNYKFAPTLKNALVEQLTEVAKWAIESGIALEGAEIPDYRTYIYQDALREVKPSNVDIR